jgi:hypothetical protein
LWEQPLALAGVMLLSTVPLWTARVPPLIDLPGHMGRYHVELDLARSALLQRNWDFHWALIGNLGVDLLIVPLSGLLGLQRAVWLVALLLPPLMIWGLARMSRALHGQVSPFVLAAAPFALAYPYQYGFVNYWLSCALAFHAFASWAEAAGRPALRRAVAFAPAALVIWLAHAYGWAILLVLAGAFELTRAWTSKPARWPAMALGIAGRIWPIAVPLLLMLAWRQGGAGASTGHFFDLGQKLLGMLSTLRDQSPWLDVTSLLFALILVHIGVREAALRVNPALGLAAAIFLGLILVMPGQLFGSAFADTRLWPVFFMAALAAIGPASPRWRGLPVVAGLALALLVARVAVTSAGFAAYDQAYARHLRALDRVPPGASIAVLARSADCDSWRHERVAHLGSLAIMRKDAFVNSQWEIPGGQLLTPLHARGTAFNADPSQYLEAGCADAAGPALARKIGQIPRDRFDYVWLLGFDMPRLAAPTGLTRLYSDDRSALYRLSPDGLQAGTSGGRASAPAA